mmetsp:Transcript_4866/g.15662  ORF Transcript_4866/g.15662 Transcript_4866/m.15662 type:complete len:249 (-) Transcript_4866:266-1012(-)
MMVSAPHRSSILNKSPNGPCSLIHIVPASKSIRRGISNMFSPARISSVAHKPLASFMEESKHGATLDTFASLPCEAAHFVKATAYPFVSILQTTDADVDVGIPCLLARSMSSKSFASFSSVCTRILLNCSKTRCRNSSGGSGYSSLLLLLLLLHSFSFAGINRVCAMACADVSFLGDTKKVLLLLEVVGGEFCCCCCCCSKAILSPLSPRMTFPHVSLGSKYISFSSKQEILHALRSISQLFAVVKSI